MDTSQYRSKRGLGLILDDRLWQQSIGVARHFSSVRNPGARDWTHNERSLADMMYMGLLDLNSEHRSNDASSRAMRFSSILADRLWSMIEKERSRVRVLLVEGVFPFLILCLAFREIVWNESCTQLVTR